MDLRDGTLIREDGTGLLFLILDGKLSVIENSDIFDATNATTLSPADLNRLRANLGPPITRNAYLATANGHHYLVNNNRKRRFTSQSSISRYHINLAKFTSLPPSSLPSPTDPDLT